METLALQNMPPEILLDIQSNLSYASRIALRLTCRELHLKIDDPDRHANDNHTGAEDLVQTTRRCYSMKDLLEIEMWPEYNSAQDRSAGSKQPFAGFDFFACNSCHRIRCASRFSNAMMKGKRGKLGSGTHAEKSGRFCISCGIRVGIYKRGDWLQYGGALGSCAYICRKCGSFVPVSFGYLAVNERVCLDC
ncbi:hypothetical protein T440DRAFT_473671 [Plenodomus tracheiphilus IPT5]|uniref:F-box domain-containing protein n=1 Tax=Plenodomus tracheiphilus IPT5 TaxID=1408161 RepID=A0A6A7ALV3_9PLEO|nr:hypothetical protein T440DRAFT_473671 [Plenodomus tracheiphilus IPT5]